MMKNEGEFHETPRETMGLFLGGLAVLFWSTSSACIALGGARMSIWTYLSLTAGVAGLTQLAIHRAQKGKPGSCFFLPWRLWLGGIVPFVVYGLVYPVALAISVSPSQQLAVNLTNYLWPVLTVVFSVLWVPGIQMTRRLIVAIVLAVGGLILANVSSIRQVFEDPGRSVWPYVLGGTGAVMWGVYSSLLARWRNWARAYQIAPMGFVWIGLLAGVIAVSRGEWRWPIGEQWLIILVNGLLPWGLGYLLWEKALHRARASTLGVFGATIPVTSTLLLCLVQQHRPSGTTLVAAMVMTTAVVLTIRRRKEPSPAVMERMD